MVRNLVKSSPKKVYEFLNVPTQHEQDMGGSAIYEIEGKRYKCNFAMDASYAGQSKITTMMFTKDVGWANVLLQKGLENPLVAEYHNAAPTQRGDMLRSGLLRKRIEIEMRRLCAFAAMINE